MNSEAPDRGPIRVVYFPVHDVDYPRNRLIRTKLKLAGYDCVVISREHGAFEKTKLRRKFRAFVELLRHGRASDVIVLSEMSLQYAPLTWTLSRLFNTVHVVDGFVGLYETRVLDWKRYRPSSFRGRILALCDKVAYRSADIYLVDTDARGRVFDSSPNVTVLTVPVGAPEWARPLSRVSDRSGRLRLLHYGNYAPLHGVETIVRALSELVDRGLDVELVLIGDGAMRAGIEAEVKRLGLDDRCSFVGRVKESDLAEWIADCDIVLGIFGDSAKAASVIPNKVWQGLACGRMVLTRESSALSELASIVGDQLQTIPASDERALADKVIAVSELSRLQFPLVSQKLAHYTDRRCAELVQAIHASLARGAAK